LFNPNARQLVSVNFTWEAGRNILAFDHKRWFLLHMNQSNLDHIALARLLWQIYNSLNFNKVEFFQHYYNWADVF